jgi:hypothetical protein
MLNSHNPRGKLSKLSIVMNHLIIVICIFQWLLCGFCALYGYLYLFITIILKKLFKIFNIEIKRKRKNFDEIYQYNLINKKKIYIFDIGANTGQCIRRFKGIFPNSIIHSFEPIKEVFDILKENFISKNIVINNYACGDKNSFKILILINYLTHHLF